MVRMFTSCIFLEDLEVITGLAVVIPFILAAVLFENTDWKRACQWSKGKPLLYIENCAMYKLCPAFPRKVESV
jgi:hypothetical protein